MYYTAAPVRMYFKYAFKYSCKATDSRSQRKLITRFSCGAIFESPLNSIYVSHIGGASHKYSFAASTSVLICNRSVMSRLYPSQLLQELRNLLFRFEHNIEQKRSNRRVFRREERN